MNQKQTVLIIDDHPIILDAYKSAFNKLSLEDKNFSFQIETANNCDRALDKIEKASRGKGIEIIILDIQLPPSSNGEILSGEDLGIKIKELLPESKIIISTSLNDNFRIKNIFKNINPDGYLIKNDINSDELLMAIQMVLQDKSYYSNSVLKSFRRIILNEYVLDEIDRKMLHEISLGSTMKELSNALPLSIGGLEKRKRNLKEIFNVSDETDRALIEVAKNKGFI